MKLTIYVSLNSLQKLCRLIGAIIIVVGVYLVLWGKTKGKLSYNSDTKEAPSSCEQMANASATAEASNQNFVVLDVSKEAAAADESVEEKQNQIP